MYRYLPNIPEYRTIEIKTCINRGGHEYDCPFIGSHALSRAMKNALERSNIGCSNGCTIPVSFFDDYDLIECEYNPANPSDEEFVTSNLWYTCREKVNLLELPAEFIL